MTEASPFASKRYEHDGSPVYYIPPKAFRLLEAAVPTFLVGTRGTGKTTLMRALSWDERLYNPSLQAQLDSDPFSERYIGLYFKLPTVQLGLIERWLGGEEDVDYASLFALYLDLCWLETLATALRHLSAQRVLAVSDDEEGSFAREFDDFWRQWPACCELIGSSGRSISDALSLMHPLRRTIERFARNRLDPSQALDILPAGQIGSFGRTVAKMLTSRLRAVDGSSDHSKWSIRVCMDEGEVLTLRQQRVLNSMIRLTEWPLFYLIAYVSRPHDATTTYLPNQTLQKADRQILVRDEMSDRDFRTLAEGVVNVRLRSYGSPKQTLKTNKLLGPLDLNGLLVRILGQSEDPESRRLLEAARAAAIGDEGPPPIFETYLQWRRPELSRDTDGSSFQRRRQSSAGVRKQMVAAYLSICREAGSRPMYASSDMVFQIADKCVRDYLWEMDALFTDEGKGLHDFLASSIDAARQNHSLQGAAREKIALLKERVISAAAEANQFVDGLAQITAIIQSTGRNFEQLRTPERGIFSYRRDPSVGRVADEHLYMIRDAAEAGFLRIVEDDESAEIRFRVHASLAPYYGFSYRGAYYSAAVLADEDIYALRSASTTAAMASAVNSIVTRVTGRRPSKRPANQLVLSVTEDDDD